MVEKNDNYVSARDYSIVTITKEIRVILEYPQGMLLANKTGRLAYRFPMGVLGEEEDPLDAVKRIVKTKTGFLDIIDTTLIGKVVIGRPDENLSIGWLTFDIQYYYCKVDTYRSIEPEFTEAEQKMLMTASVISTKTFLENNKTHLQMNNPYNYDWLDLDTWFLEEYQKENTKEGWELFHLTKYPSPPPEEPPVKKRRKFVGYPTMKKGVLRAYCEAHPRRVYVVEEPREEDSWVKVIPKYKKVDKGKVVDPEETDCKDDDEKNKS